MVVMETVRAATLASSRKKERLEAPLPPPLPLAASSPSDGKSKQRVIVSEESRAYYPPSPITSGNSGNVSDEIIRYRNQNYVAPEKLQIVKPLEGSMTLLKWKLLATPQLGGATTFFSDASQPGVHRKKWKAGGVIDSSQTGLAGTRIKSLSTTDMSSLQHHNHHPPLYSNQQHGRTTLKPEGLNHSYTNTLLVATNSTSGESSDVEAASHSSRMSQSLVGQVSSFLGSGLSHLGLTRDTSANQGGGPTTHPHQPSPLDQHETGLASLLDS